MKKSILVLGLLLLPTFIWLSGGCGKKPVKTVVAIPPEPAIVTVTNTVVVTNQVEVTNVIHVAAAKARPQQRVDVTVSGNTSGGVFPVIIQQLGGKEGDEHRNQRVSLHITTPTNSVSATPTNPPPVAIQSPPPPAPTPQPASAPVVQPPAASAPRLDPASKTAQWTQPPPPPPMVYQQPPTLYYQQPPIVGYDYLPPGYYQVPRYSYYGGPSFSAGIGFGGGSYYSVPRFNGCSTGGKGHRSRH